MFISLPVEFSPLPADHFHPNVDHRGGGEDGLHWENDPKVTSENGPRTIFGCHFGIDHS